MNHLKLAQKNREKEPESYNALYRHLTLRAIRKKAASSLNEENAILRKTIFKLIGTMIEGGILSEEDARLRYSEFYELHEAVERCKEEAKTDLGIDKEG